MAPPVVSNAKIVKQLTTSWEGEVGVTKTWDGPTVTFTINGSAPLLPLVEHFGAQAMTASETGMARLAFQQWNELSNLHLLESASGGDITFNYSTGVPDFALGETFDSTVFNPFDGGDRKLNGASIWMNANSGSAASDAVTVGSYGFTAYMHEIGHALGLSHPGAYNASDPSGPTYANDAQYSRDTRQYSIMSYFSQGSDGSGADFGGFNPETPMIDDILAIQAKYGANMTTRASSTVYGFGSNVSGADAAIYNFSQNSHPVFTIWDAGGTDTINASGFSADQRIDLRAGTYSDVGGLKQNIGIAYNVTIENATGGSGNDSLLGNGASNVLIGGAGADTLNGGAAFDNLTGGTGNDSYVLQDVNFQAGLLRFDNVNEFAGGGIDAVRVQAATGFNALIGAFQTVSNYTLAANVENGVVTGTAAFDLAGNANANTLTGNSAANVLSGGAANDTLNGGGGFDTLDGGTGDDTFVLNDAVLRGLVNPGGPILFTPQFDAVLEGLNGGVDTVLVGRATAPGTVLAPAATATSYTLTDNVENGTVSGTGAFDLFGNGLDNKLTGNAAANSLGGGAGADTLDGRAGFDTLAGNAGDDVYILGDVTMQPLLLSNGLPSGAFVPTYDAVTEAAGEGVDTVQVAAASVLDNGVFRSASSYTLGANIEIGRIVGSGAFSLTGNGLDNQLFGNGAANGLDGGAGDDVLTGGLGSDTFSYLNAGFGKDAITDFSAGAAVGHDVLAISRLFAADFGAAMASFSQVGGDAVMNLGGAGAITLQNTSVASLTAVDFRFV